MKNKSVINTTQYSAVLLPTTGNRARNTLSQLAANHVSSPSTQLQHLLWSGIAVTIVTIAATRSSCHQSVPVPATSAHYPLVPRCGPEVSTSVRHKHYYKLNFLSELGLDPAFSYLQIVFINCRSDLPRLYL